MITFLLSPLGSPRRRLIPFSLLLTVLTVSAILATNLSKAGQETTVHLDRSYEEAWKEVEKLDEKDLPKDALPVVEDILMQARRERNEQQQCRALLYITKYTAALSEDGQLSAIEKLEGESRQSKGITAAVSRIYLAQLYESYFQREQYRITTQTAGAIVTEDDVATWDLERFATRIRSLQEQALDDEILLQNARVQDYPIILSLAEDQDRSYQSTLFEVLLSEIVKQKQNSRVLALANTSPRFRVDGTEYFGLGEDFRKLELPKTDSLSPTYQTLLLEQKLVDFLISSDFKTGLAYADLSRLTYIQQQSTLDNSLELLINALQVLAESNTETELYTRIVSGWGVALLQESEAYDVMKPEQRPELRDQRKKILLALDAAIDAFPDSEGAKNCRNLKAQIRQRELEVQLPEVAYPGEEILGTLRFKNLSQVEYDIWKCDYENWSTHLNRYRAIDWKNILKNSNRVSSAPVGLNDHGDYYAHRIHLPVGKLDAGYYILVARDADKSKDMDPVYSPFQVSKLGQLTAQSEDGGLDVFVLDRKNGQVIPGAHVQVLELDNSRESGDRILAQQTVDGKGHTRFYSTWTSYRNNLRIISGDAELLITEPIHISGPRQERENQSYLRTVFFTDRSIYRPGQTIMFKGVQYTGKENPVAVKEGAEVIIEIRGPNNTSIATLTLRTNRFGSFTGSFMAPAGLTGNYYIRSSTGSTSISVEEYKRPRFEVNIDPLEGEAELDQQVQVSGKASTYSGVPVQEAKVSWRVVREPAFPWWWWRCWTGGFERESNAEIASGISTTDEEGVFELEFKALAGNNERIPQYRFRITADVTDISGETRSGSNAVTIARTSVSLGVELAGQIDLRNSPDLKVLATNADGQAVAIKGTARIKKLTPHNRLLYPDLLSPVDQPMVPISEFRKLYPHQPYVDLESREAREPLRPIWEKDFETSEEDAQGFDLGEFPTDRWYPGEYLLHVFTTDASGQLVEFKRYFTLYDSDSRKLPMQLFSWLETGAESAIPGETVRYRFGTSIKVPVLFEVRHRNEIIQQQWRNMNGSIEEFDIPVTGDHRGGLDVEFVYVAEGRVHREHHHLEVPWTNKDLRLSMETMRSVLRPGAGETWTVSVEAVEGESGPIEMMALMYDASLDAIRPHQIDKLVYFPTSPSSPRWYQTTMFGTRSKSKQSTYDLPRGQAVRQNWLNWYNTHQAFTYGWMGVVGDIRMFGSPVAESADFRYDDADGVTQKVALGNASLRSNYRGEGLIGLMDNANEGEFKSDNRNPEDPAESAEPALRKNLQETAFFYPQLRADEDGGVSFTFNSPEALTRWNLLGMAHTPDLKSGTLSETVVTRKELMVTPNFPRFFREGDEIVVTAKIDNTSEDTLSGGAVLEVYDAITEVPAGEQLGLIEARRAWSAESGKSTMVSWRIKVPDSGLGAVRYVVRASAGNFSDGEEHIAPVLKDRILITESMAIAIPGAGEFEFEMDNLRRSKDVQHQLVAVEFSSNPAWYAVQSLPYLMEYPHDCNEQIFSRYYANSIASHLANSDPSIARVFEQWKGTDALLSNLEKNEDLKRILIEETPWLQEAQGESARKQRLGILFDLVRMESESRQALGKLFQNQSPSGGWPWFSGGQESSYITQHILAGFGQLNRMGLGTAPEVEGMLIRAINYIDRETGKHYDDLRKSPGFKAKEYIPSAWVIHYLYMRSFYDQEYVRGDALNFFLDRAEASWVEKGEYERGMIALATHRIRPQSDVPNDILKSLSQNAQRDEELGMYWPDVTRGYYWYQRPIETQSLLIEAYHEITEDSDAVEAIKLWLLKNKQTSDWGTTKATAKACYALLGTGRNLLLSREIVEVQAGNKLIDPHETRGGVDAGTGYFRHNFGTAEISEELAAVTVKKKDEGIAWGAMHWQYFTDLDKVESVGGALRISKEIYKKVNSKSGPKLIPLKEESLKVGDRVVVRLVMETDRELEFVHLKDGRASGLEPRDVISGHRWQGGISYYQSTRDASTNFFLDRLRPGKWVFEYELTAFQSGDFSAGPAEVQCMYAPEFNAHSDGFRVRVEAD